jgi:hypothetical protein
MLCLPHPYIKAKLKKRTKTQKPAKFLYKVPQILHKCVFRGAIASDNKVMEALDKFMKAFNKKRIEMKRKSILKEWGGVNGSTIEKDLTSDCQLWLECS